MHTRCVAQETHANTQLTHSQTRVYSVVRDQRHDEYNDFLDYHIDIIVEL